MLTFIRIVGVALGLIFALTLATDGWAQTYPNRPITFVVPYPTGGTVDTVTRLVTRELAVRLDQTIIIKNKPGAVGIIAARDGARAEPDGYTVLVRDLSLLVTHPHLYKDLGYDPLRDFAPVSLLAKFSQDFFVNGALPVKTFPEFLSLAKAKAKSDPMSYASMGQGSLLQLAMERLKQQVGMELSHLPYKDSGAAARGLVAGEVQAMLVGSSTVRPFLQSGQIRPLAVGSMSREAALPDVPTFDEAGVKGFTAYAWFAVVAPAGTDKDIVARLSREMQPILASAEIKERFGTLGMEAAGNSPQQLADYIKQEYASWGTVIKAANIHLEE